MYNVHCEIYILLYIIITTRSLHNLGSHTHTHIEYRDTELLAE